MLLINRHGLTWAERSDPTKVFIQHRDQTVVTALRFGRALYKFNWQHWQKKSLSDSNISPPSGRCINEKCVAVRMFVLYFCPVTVIVNKRSGRLSASCRQPRQTRGQNRIISSHRRPWAGHQHSNSHNAQIRFMNGNTFSARLTSPLTSRHTPPSVTTRRYEYNL